MRVSVIIPAYNEEKYLAECLTALLNQEVKADEIIVVNNNSKDNTVSIASSFPVTVIHETTQGLSFARNTGFNTAIGDVMGRIDADTIVPPEWIERLKANFIDESVVGISGPVIFYDFPGGKIAKKIIQLLHILLYFRIAKFVLGQDVMFGSNHAIRKSAWEKIKDTVCTNDKKYHEDTDLTAHISQYGRIVYDKDFIANISSRRVRNLRSLIDYAIRHYKGLRHAHNILNAKD